MTPRTASASWSAAVFSWLVAIFLLGPLSSARAQVQTWRPAPLYVLTIQTDDADDQADGLTEALRAYVRSLPGWALGETPQSFETLAIALRCPTIPDAPCLQRIGDQLRAEHFIWGTLARGQRGEVSVELHLWKRGGEETRASAAYSDVLKDASDSRLRAVAKNLLEKLTQAHLTGAIVVQASGQEGDVAVDDAVRGSLKDGTARIIVGEGTHTVELRGPGDHKSMRTVTAVGGTDVTVVFQAVPAAVLPTTPPEPRPQASHLRPILGYSALAVGVGLLVVAGVEAANWQDDKNASDQDRSNVPSSVPDVCADGSPAAQDACAKSHDAKTVSALAWVFGAAGAVVAGTGIWLLATPQHASGEGEAAHLPPLELVPQLGAHEHALSLRLRF